jgi:hypothetical protein
VRGTTTLAVAKTAKVRTVATREIIIFAKREERE